jgi:hypothetical protein
MRAILVSRTTSPGVRLLMMIISIIPESNGGEVPSRINTSAIPPIERHGPLLHLPSRIMRRQTRQMEAWYS